jgi:hypothetical protein
VLKPQKPLNGVRAGKLGHNVESVLTSYVTLIYLLPHRDNL